MSNTTSKYPGKTPEERVKSFLTHWYQQWSHAQDTMGDDVDFEVWRILVSEVDHTHFIDGAGCNSQTSFSSNPDFDPNIEKITKCIISDNSAQIYSELYSETLDDSHYHVFELINDASNNWLISGILILLYPPDNPVIELTKQAETLKMSIVDAPLIKGEEDLDLNENILFGKDRIIKCPNIDEGLATISTIGKLNLKSGVLGILDLGYDIYDFEPLHRKVEPGEYVVETVTIHNRVVAIRIRLNSNEVPIKWYAANTPSGNGVYGVDAGNLAFFDVESFFDLTYLKKEKLFNQWCRSGEPELLSITEKNDCFITSSGYGDGSYPAFWGVNEEDKIVSFFLDFMILIEETKNGIYVSV